jgi:hypothetical protein
LQYAGEPRTITNVTNMMLGDAASRWHVSHIEFRNLVAPLC